MLDASVITSYLLGEENSGKTYSILRTEIERGFRPLTLEFAYIEVANALWRACALRDLLNAKAVLESITSLYSLPLDPARLDEELTTRATKLALDAKLPVYDTVYIALAERERAALLTSDRKQHSEAQKHVEAVLL